MIYLWNTNFNLYFQQLEPARHKNSSAHPEGTGQGGFAVNQTFVTPTSLLQQKRIPRPFCGMGVNTHCIRSDLKAWSLHGTSDQSLLIWDYWAGLACTSRTGHSSCPTRCSKERNHVKEQQFQAIIRNSLTRFFRISEG